MLYYFSFFLLFSIGGNKFVYTWFLFLTFSESRLLESDCPTFFLIVIGKIFGQDTAHSIRSEVACAPSCLSRVPHYMSLLKSLKVETNVESIANSPIPEESTFIKF